MSYVQGEPLSLIVAPYTCYLAPVGTTFPALSGTPSGSWTKVGERGTKSYSEAGVTVTHSETLASFQGAGATEPGKVWRTDEATEVAFELATMTPAQYALILDDVTITTVAATTGATGSEKFSLTRGPEVHIYALLLRGPSAMGPSSECISQYKVPACYQAANQAPKYSLKGGPGMLAVQFTTIEDGEGLEPEFETQTPRT